jgi:hypothetical protein
MLLAAPEQGGLRMGPAAQPPGQQCKARGECCLGAAFAGQHTWREAPPSPQPAQQRQSRMRFSSSPASMKLVWQLRPGTTSHDPRGAAAYRLCAQQELLAPKLMQSL